MFEVDGFFFTNKRRILFTILLTDCIAIIGFFTLTLAIDMLVLIQPSQTN